MSAEPDELVVNGDLVTFHGRLRWGEPPREQPLEATFRVTDGQVVELWTKRENYVPVLGEQFCTSWGFAVFFVQMVWHCVTHREA